MDLVKLNGKTIEFSLCFDEMTVYITNRLSQQTDIDRMPHQQFVDVYTELHYSLFGTQFTI
jgi:hypothetical protein